MLGLKIIDVSKKSQSNNQPSTAGHVHITGPANLLISVPADVTAPYGSVKD